MMTAFFVSLPWVSAASLQPRQYPCIPITGGMKERSKKLKKNSKAINTRIRKRSRSKESALVSNKQAWKCVLKLKKRKKKRKLTVRKPKKSLKKSRKTTGKQKNHAS